MLAGYAPPIEVVPTMNTYHDEEDALVHHDLQRSGWQEDMPEDNRTGPVDRSARPPQQPPNV